MSTIQTNQVGESGFTIPGHAGNMIRKNQFGIHNTLQGFIIQSESITCDRMTDTTQDQQGAVVSQLDYDEHWTCTLQVIGNGLSGTSDVETEQTSMEGDLTERDNVPELPDVGDTNVEYAGKLWKCQNVSYNGSFDQKKSWTITLERWKNFPTQLPT